LLSWLVMSDEVFNMIATGVLENCQYMEFDKYPPHMGIYGKMIHKKSL